MTKTTTTKNIYVVVNLIYLFLNTQTRLGIRFSFGVHLNVSTSEL